VKATIETLKGKGEKSEATLISLILRSGKRKIAYKTERRFLLLLEDINNSNWLSSKEDGYVTPIAIVLVSILSLLCKAGRFSTANYLIFK
jgi:hypothetical protein